MKPKQKKNPLAKMTAEQVFAHLASMGIVCKPELVVKPYFEPFAMLYTEGGGPPTLKHASFVEAFAEAKRLALKMNKTVYLLEAIGCVAPQPQEIIFGEPKLRLPVAKEPETNLTQLTNQADHSWTMASK